MRFNDYLARPAGPIISFELFPPKTDAAMGNLRRILPELIELRPTCITVTYGALGSTRQRTLEIAALIKREYGMESACHLTCVGSSRADIDRMLGEILRAGIENIVALRGDPPKGETTFVPPPDGYAHANELVAHIRRWEQQSRAQEELTTHHSPLTTHHSPLSGFGIAVAGYPEKHVEAPDLATDLANLKRKVEAGADLVITQLFYDNADYFRFVESARAIGITCPIIPGLLPIQSAKQIRRITSMCGSKIPPSLLAELELVADEDAKAEEVGIRQCVAQATELLEHGVPGIHFYVLNKSSHMRRILRDLVRGEG